jgi:predicted TIM-barrel fold metal-dependent hydrolase
VGAERLIISDIRGIENDPDGGNARAIEASAQFPGRIYVHAVYSPGKYADNVEAFERVLDQPGVISIKFHCQLHNTAPESPKYRPAFEAANARGLAILTHGVLPPDMLRDLLKEMPNLTYVAAHFGASPPEDHEAYVPIANEFSNFYFDTTGSVMKLGGFRRLVEAMPPEQIVYGSDFPVMDLPYQLGRILYADIGDELKQKILWENPARICKRA